MWTVQRQKKERVALCSSSKYPWIPPPWGQWKLQGGGGAKTKNPSVGGGHGHILEQHIIGCVKIISSVFETLQNFLWKSLIKPAPKEALSPMSPPFGRRKLLRPQLFVTTKSYSSLRGPDLDQSQQGQNWLDSITAFWFSYLTNTQYFKVFIHNWLLPSLPIVIKDSQV